MGISTSNIQTGGGGIPKLVQPGNRVVKVTNVYLEEFTFKPGGYHLMLDVAGPDLGDDFEGFLIDKDNEALGRHKGQIGRVKASEWAFADGETKSGIIIKRDDEILKFLKNFCEAAGCEDWLTKVDGKYETIEELVAGFNEDKPFEGKFLSTCLGGREYENKQGYTNYDLYFPKFTRQGIPFESEDVEEGVSRVAKFNPDVHIKVKKAKPVTEFSGNASETGGDTAKADFDLEV